MASSGAASPAAGEVIGFLDHFKDLRDPRQQGKVDYPLDEILLLCLTATLAGAEHVTEIALFGETKLGLLRQLRPFANGTPRHDHLGDILATLDAEQFQRCFAAWVGASTGLPEGVIAIDGKTSRRTRGKGKAALHLVSAFAARQRLVLGQVAVADKSNEIVAIPKLLDLLQIEGAIVSIDAMGCQREIARKIVDKKADYILALKGNQGSLREDAELFADEQIARDFADTTVSRAQTVDGEHGRIETRTLTVMHDVDWLRQRHDWPGLTALAMVESVREIAGKVERERRFYITSSSLPAECLASAIRDHWSIESVPQTHTERSSP
jgi:predicted transposase YbfD/YdcC